MVLLLMTALTIVLMTTIVGIIMVIALLTLPAAVASLFAKKLWKIMVIAVFITMIFSVFGIGLSYILDTPGGSTIILFAGALYLLSIAVRKIAGAVQKRQGAQRG